MLFYSTRSQSTPVSGAQAILGGIAPDGGLYVPERFPQITPEQIAAMSAMPYDQRACTVLSAFLDQYSRMLPGMCQAAYGADRFDTPQVAPVIPLGDRQALELFHGPTLAFKDMALQMLPYLMTGAMQLEGTTDEVVILVATSGDTGKAALEGFKDVAGTRVIVFYPDGGVSPAQKLQMVTQQGGNVHVAAVRGNFDDAQTGVKKIFADDAFKARIKARGKALSSANSINFGRLVPQVAYYFSAYADMVRAGAIQQGAPMNVCVPTGNFGNILAAWYAKQMGLPIARFLCASNKNNVLTDFINTGVYDANRDFYKTTSPSMDILISSNVERLLFELCSRDGQQVGALMQALSQQRKYTLPAQAAQALKAQFVGAWADDETAAAEIQRVYREHGVVLDPHSAVASAVYTRYRAQSGDETPTLVVCTASPYKFSRSVLCAIDSAQGLDEFGCADRLEALSGVPMPAPLRALRTLPVRHQTVCDRQQMEATVDAFLTK